MWRFVNLVCSGSLRLCCMLDLEAYGTEYLTWYIRSGIPVCAGQIDAILRSSSTGEFYLVDWKRVQKRHILGVDEPAFGGRTGVGLCGMILDTHFHRYSLQCSLYAVMLRHSHNIDVGDRMYLVRVHSDRETYELVRSKCTGELCYPTRFDARSLAV